MRSITPDSLSWAAALLSAGTLIACDDAGGPVSGGTDAGVVPWVPACTQLPRYDRFPDDCAGSPEGRWRLVTWCPSAEGFDPLSATCPSAAYEVWGEGSGELTLDGNGAYELRFLRRAQSLESQIPLDCYGGDDRFCRGDALGGNCGSTSEVCVCEQVSVAANVAEAGVWQLGSERTFTSLSAGGVAQVSAFCVTEQGSALLVERFSSGSALGARMYLVRQQ